MSDSVRPQRWQPTRLPRPWDSPGKNTGVGCHFLLQCMKVKSESEVTQSCPTLSDPMTAAHQAPLSMGFSRQEYWSGVPLPSPFNILIQYKFWHQVTLLPLFIPLFFYLFKYRVMQYSDSSITVSPQMASSSESPHASLEDIKKNKVSIWTCIKV